MNRQLTLMTAALVVALPLGAARAAGPVTRVHGAGVAALTDPEWVSYPGNLFAIEARIRSSGAGAGPLKFLLGPSFSGPWGAVPGVDLIYLDGRVTAGEVAANGTVTLRGELTEIDYSFDDGVVFVEENVPFTLVIPASGGETTFTWCLLPVFDLTVTHGRLQVK